MPDDADYEAWAQTVPSEITTDTIWRTPAYRFSLYASFCAQSDPDGDNPTRTRHGHRVAEETRKTPPDTTIRPSYSNQFQLTANSVVLGVQRTANGDVLLP